MKSVQVVLLSILAGALYGIVHDQVTARVCIEYFTIGHAPIFATRSPTLLAIGWGIIATWWVSLFLGISLAAAARLGRAPKQSVRELIRPMGMLLLGMGVVALISGLVGYARAKAGAIDPWVTANIQPSQRVAFMADLWAHTASYASGAIGGLFLCAYVWLSRHRGTWPD